jgi:predicted Rossmann fold flavoprotein
MIERDIIIIGGGASGLMAAALAHDTDLSVAVLERNYKCGQKLLITGKGRCNITNTSSWSDFSSHIHPSSAFFKTSFYNLSNQDVISFFNKIGLETKEERGKRVFPTSDKSVDVLNALLNHIEKGGVEVRCLTKVTSIKKDSEGCFILSSVVNKQIENSRSACASLGIEMFKAKVVIVATGGLSYPVTGSTGDGYEFAQLLGHTLSQTFPSLTALFPSKFDYRLEGITLKNIKLDLVVNDICTQSEMGELTFTKDGIEGALGFRVSRRGVKALIDGQKVELHIDLKPAVTTNQLSDRITKDIAKINDSIVRKQYTERKKLEYMLRFYLPKNIIAPFIDLNKDISLSNSVKYLKKWAFKIDTYGGYKRSVVTVGGIPLEEISRKTMESKIVKNLFFAGEVINLDGDTGGYNLQIAFSTAATAIKSAIDSLKEKSNVTNK